MLSTTIHRRSVLCRGFIFTLRFKDNLSAIPACSPLSAVFPAPSAPEQEREACRSRGGSDGRAGCSTCTEAELILHTHHDAGPESESESESTTRRNGDPLSPCGMTRESHSRSGIKGPPPYDDFLDDPATSRGAAKKGPLNANEHTDHEASSTPHRPTAMVKSIVTVISLLVRFRQTGVDYPGRCRLRATLQDKTARIAPLLPRPAQSRIHALPLALRSLTL